MSGILNENNMRVRITKFIQWNDRHASDENCDLEEVPRMTYEEAIKYSKEKVFTI